MAYGGVASLSDAVTGAKAIQDIMSAPSAGEAERAKSGYEIDRYKGLQEYMKAEKASIKPGEGIVKGVAGDGVEDKALAVGQSTYSMINTAQELQQRKQSLREEEQRIKNLAPEDRAHAEATIERMQKDIDNLDAKLLKERETHLGERFSLLESVKDQPSLDGARTYAKKAISALADKAIEEGKIHPSNRDAFINDNLNKILPIKYDAAGKAQLESERSGMMSIKDQIEMKKAEAANKRAMAELEKADAANRRQTLLIEKQLRSGDMRVLSEERQNITNQLAANNKMIEDYDREIANQQKEMQLIPDTVSTGLFSSDVNPDKAVAKTRINDLREAVKSLRESNSTLGLQREVLMKKIGVPSADEAKVDKGSSKRSSLPSGVNLSPGIHEDSAGNKIKVFEDGTYEEVK